MNREAPMRRRPVGAACAAASGVLYLAVILYAVAVPIGGRFEAGRFFPAYADDPALMNSLWGAMSAVSLLSLAVIPSLSGWLGREGDEWISIGRQFGIAGSIVSAAGFLTLLGSAPGAARTYLEGDAAVRAAIHAVGLPQLDPLHILSLGGTGLWFLIVNLSARRWNVFRNLHAGLGILLGVFLLAAVLATVCHWDLLDAAASAIGGLCAPVWYFLTAAQLLQSAPRAECR
jgi:hypothetical protein